MELLEAIMLRHSVRAYEDKKIEGSVREMLQQKIEECNRESGLHMQLVLDEPKAFDSFLAHYGKFSGVKNYVAVVGKKSEDLDETCGYYGEKLVLYAQTLGLNTCWVGLTYSKVKDAFVLEDGEKLYCVISIGYGTTQGIPHKSKPFEKVTKTGRDIPDWFREGVKAALLAPTAVNQQKFTFILEDKKVTAKPGMGFYSKMDLGIVKYHFEIGAGTENFTWK